MTVSASAMSWFHWSRFAVVSHWPVAAPAYIASALTFMSPAAWSSIVLGSPGKGTDELRFVSVRRFVIQSGS